MSAPPAKNYWAFISYASKDRKWGEWLHRRLESYPIPLDLRGQKIFDGATLGKHLRPIFRDRDELAGSADLGEQIRVALEGSRFLVVLCSRNSAKSRWVNKEIEDFKKLGRERRILAVILDGQPNASSGPHPEEECFPPALRLPVEPIAGDLRKDGDGKERGFLKVLAGIAQIDFDGLYRRHQRRKAKIQFMVGAGALGLILGFAALAGFAVIGLLTAMLALNEAKTQTAVAEQTTQFLTGMFESIDPATAKLREITVREVLDEASKNIDGAFPGQPKAEIRIRASFAKVYALLGRGELALMHAKENVLLTRSLAGRKPHPALAHTLNMQAVVLEGLGRSEEALKLEGEALEIQRKLSKGDHPHVAASLNNVAIYLQKLGRLDEALTTQREALEMRIRLFRGDHPDVADSLNNVAVCLHSLGRTEDSRRLHIQALEMRRRIFKNDHPTLASSLNNAAVYMTLLGRPEESIALHHEAIEMQRRFYEGDHPAVAATLASTARSLRALGRTEEALDVSLSALEMRRRVFHGDHPEVASSLQSVGICLSSLGRLAEALTVQQEALEIRRRLAKGDHPDVAASLAEVALVFEALGRNDASQSAGREALAIAERVLERIPTHEEMKRIRKQFSAKLVESR